MTTTDHERSARRWRRTSAALAAALAASVAIGAGLPATAVTLITSAEIKDGTIQAVDVRSGTLTGAKVRDASLTGADVRDGSVRGVDVRDKSIGRIDLVPGLLAHDAVAVGLPDVTPPDIALTQLVTTISFTTTTPGDQLLVASGTSGVTYTGNVDAQVVTGLYLDGAPVPGMVRTAFLTDICFPLPPCIEGSAAVDLNGLVLRDVPAGAHLLELRYGTNPAVTSASGVWPRFTVVALG